MNTTNTTTTQVSSAQEVTLSFKAWLNSIIQNDLITSLILAFILLIISSFLIHLGTRLIRKLLSRENSPLPQSSIFINIWRVIAWVVAGSFIFSTCFDIDVTGAITALGVGGIALSLGLQDTISNLIGGVQMSLMKTVNPGDHVEVGGRKGVVKDITWRQMSMETSNGQTIIVPNSTINNGTLVKLPPIQKIVVPVSLYKNFDDLEEATKEMLDAVRADVEKVCPVEKDPFIQFTTVSEYSYSGSLVIWCEIPDDDYPKTAEVTDVVVRTIATFSPKI